MAEDGHADHRANAAAEDGGGEKGFFRYPPDRFLLRCGFAFLPPARFQKGFILLRPFLVNTEEDKRHEVDKHEPADKVPDHASISRMLQTVSSGVRSLSAIRSAKRRYIGPRTAAIACRSAPIESGLPSRARRSISRVSRMMVPF